MEGIKASRFKFDFFLPKRTKVEGLVQGANSYGGATRIKDMIYSNYGEDDVIQVNKDSNELAIFVPSTVNINHHIDSTSYVERTLEIMHKRFDNVEVIAGEGSYKDDDTGEVIVEDITIVRAYVGNEVTTNDIEFMKTLAQVLKKDMTQKGVTITINDAMAIV